jgi:hypothetical protein
MQISHGAFCHGILGRPCKTFCTAGPKAAKQFPHNISLSLSLSFSLSLSLSQLIVRVGDISAFPLKVQFNSSSTNTVDWYHASNLFIFQLA